MIVSRIKGKILNNTQGNLVAANGAHVWIEDLTTGRVVASALADIAVSSAWVVFRRAIIVRWLSIVTCLWRSSWGGADRMAGQNSFAVSRSTAVLV